MYDCTIFGSGPAAYPIALGLVRKGYRVLVCEAGGETVTSKSQNIYMGRTVGDQYFRLDECRLRCLGGSSMHWGGLSRPLFDHDLTRTTSELSNWPIGINELRKYEQRVDQILEVPEKFWKRSFTQTFDEVNFQVVPITFDIMFQELKETYPNNFDYVLNTRLHQIKENRSNQATVSVFSGSIDVSSEVEAKKYVIAAGGIENSRLLLFSQETSPTLRELTSVGRYWMEHPSFRVADGLLTEKFPYEAITYSGEITLTPKEQYPEQLGIGNIGFRITPTEYSSTKQMIVDLSCIAPKLSSRIFDLFSKQLYCGIIVRAVWEQAPDVENRIELDWNDKDENGTPRVKLIWEKKDFDYKTVDVATNLLAEDFANNDLGRLRIRPEVRNRTNFSLADSIAGAHHMGGTRMSISPTTGVVDVDLAVHNFENLFISGSSVFPTGGFVNPTYNLMTLAFRLEEHLARTL